MMTLKTPIISLLIGEGGSGGALALAVADQVWMLENAIYSVISPEGCASILWKDAKKMQVSTRQSTGRWNFSACFISRSALRYPSGWAAPKLRRMLSCKPLPFSIPITVTGKFQQCVQYSKSHALSTIYPSPEKADRNAAGRAVSALPSDWQFSRNRLTK